MMDYLRRRHAPICRQWFETLRPTKMDAGLLEIQTDTTVQKNYLQRRCIDQFQEAAQATTGALVAVKFIHDDGQPNNGNGFVHQSSVTVTPEPAPARAAGPIPSTPPARPTVSLPTEPLYPDDPTYDQMVLCPDYSFDNFVTGPNSRLAYAAAVAVANQPGTAYNPLFIHGGVGLGKTHLLQAICQTILEHNPDARICYLSCDAFMNQFLECVQKGLMNEFRHRYRQLDVLMIDDIHFLARRESSQEEFFHTFNALYQANKQIVLSSDAPPAEIPELEERLVSRFQWGLVTHVARPPFETRVAIIKAKIKLRGLMLGDDVISYIATKYESNARELEGAITTIQGHAALQNRAIDIGLAQEALGDPAHESRSSQVTLQNIIEVVTDFYNVRLNDLQSKRRHKSITEPRQVCMWLARKRTRFSLQEIGGYFGGRDHTTVMHSIKTVEARCQSDPGHARQIQQLEQRIDSRQA